MVMIGEKEPSMHATRLNFDAGTAKERPITMTQATLMMLQDDNGKNQNIVKMAVVMVAMKIMMPFKESATLKETMKEYMVHERNHTGEKPLSCSQSVTRLSENQSC